MFVPRIRVLSLLALTLALSGTLFLWRQSYATVTVQAVAPTTFSYQGTLRLADGTLANGTFALTVKLYNQPVNGTALYSEAFPAVTVTAGAFSIVIGDQPANALATTLFASPNIFLGVTIGADAELLPRQRLHPVPLAMGLTTGGGVPGAVTLGVGGAKAISFPVDGANPADSAIIYFGSTALRFLPGVLQLNGNTTVNGTLTGQAVRQIGDSKGNPVQRADYAVSVSRYVVEAKDGGGSPTSVPISDTLLMQLCGDEDGCSLTLGMRNNTPQQSDNRFIMSFPYSFSIAAAIGGKRYWHAAGFADNGAPNAPSGVDGSDGSQNVINSGDCRFTDGVIRNQADQGDTALGFALLNWIGEGGHNSPDLVCVLVIKD